MKSKKSNIGFWAITSALFMLALLVVWIFYLDKYKTESEALYSKEICRQSVDTLAMTKVRVAGFQLFDALGNEKPLKCSTNYITASYSEEKRIIANAMSDCWDQFSQGNKEIFDTKDNNYCVICSRIDFKSKRQISQFTKYLIEQKVPGKQQSYAEFLGGITDDAAKQSYDNSVLEQYDRIDATKPLAVIFVMVKKVERHDIVFGAAGIVLGGLLMAGTIIAAVPSGGLSMLAAPWALGLIGAGAATTAVVGFSIGSSHGSTNFDAAILLWPYDDISRLEKCKVLEGKAAPLQVVAG